MVRREGFKPSRELPPQSLTLSCLSVPASPQRLSPVPNVALRRLRHDQLIRVSHSSQCLPGGGFPLRGCHLLEPARRFIPLFAIRMRFAQVLCGRLYTDDFTHEDVVRTFAGGVEGIFAFGATHKMAVPSSWREEIIGSEPILFEPSTTWDHKAGVRRDLNSHGPSSQDGRLRCPTDAIKWPVGLGLEPRCRACALSRVWSPVLYH